MKMKKEISNATEAMGRRTRRNEVEEDDEKRTKLSQTLSLPHHR
jgi:hypothetical protein